MLPRAMTLSSSRLQRFLRTSRRPGNSSKPGLDTVPEYLRRAVAQRPHAAEAVGVVHVHGPWPHPTGPRGPSPFHVVEHGTHESLLVHHGRYADLYELQAAAYH